ncbi:MAG: phage portal protein [Cetobacterium sp.]
MRKIKLDKNTEITTEVIKYVLEQHRLEKTRIEKLKEYYNNKNDIMDREYKDTKKPSNKLSNPYASYITNSAVGYFLGKPVSYKSENIEFLKEVNNIFTYNDEIDHNTTLAKYASIGGYAYELLYVDEKANPRFKAQAGDEVVVVFDNTLEENYLFAMRYYNEKVVGEDKEITKLEVYTNAVKNDKLEVIEQGKILYFILENNEISIDSSQDEQYHFFGDVPVVEYANPDYYGDFEKVKTLIDAYDKTQSDSANDFEMFTHAMLVVSGYVVDNDDANDINDKYIINFQEADGKAQYLVKNIQDAALENYKNRLNEDIHKFSNIPNMSDENFASNASGIAMKFKLMGLENITGIKEAKFRKGIMRRIELLCNFLKVKSNKDYIYNEIEPVFTRNRPINEVEISQMMKDLSGILSQDTLLALHPAVTDVQAEKDRLKEEQEVAFTEYNFPEVDEGAEDGQEEQE